MLRQRILTAAILIPVVVAMIIYLPPSLSSLVFAAFLVLAILEWGKLTGLTQTQIRLGGIVFLFFAILLQLSDNGSHLLPGIIYTAGLLWVAISAFVIYAHVRSKIKLDGNLGAVLKSLVCCEIVLLGAYGSALKLLHEDPQLLLLLFATIWAADIGAYFAGKKLGKRKLASKISPGKTWEGVAGGLCASVLIILLGSYWMVLSFEQRLGLLILAIIAVSFSVFGDLFESLLKRDAGVKDSGALLPGHGGALDRIDGLIAALPIFSSGYFLWISKL